MRLLFFLAFWLAVLPVLAQQPVLRGTVIDSLNRPVSGAHIHLLPGTAGTRTDSLGRFRLLLPAPGRYRIRVSHVQYRPRELTVVTSDREVLLLVVLNEATVMLPGMEVGGRQPAVGGVSPVRIDARSLRLSPEPFREITRILTTLPSVTGNNELSTAYSVRGGSYDENLVLVNNIPVYRPFLVRSGQQEGLSFVNTDLVSRVDFSPGGWPVRYDDKMASVLAATYRQPKKLAGSATASLLGAAAHLEGAIGSRLTYLAGVRHRRAAYLLNTLNTQGEYRPVFTDVQTYWTYRLSDRSSLAVLLAYASNRYRVVPEFSQTSFGTFNRELRLEVGFAGSQLMNYHTYQGALKYLYQPDSRIRWETNLSLANYFEGENIDLEGGYRLCDVDKNLGSDTFNECVAVRGIGTLYNYARNRLQALMVDVSSEIEIDLAGSRFRTGVMYSHQAFADHLNEYSFTDSAGYVRIGTSILAENNLNTNQFRFFAEHETGNGGWEVRYGVRVNYNTLNRNWLVSPRILAAYRLPARPQLSISMGAGIYGQQPFYKEYRQPDGQVNTAVRSQKGLHTNLGLSYDIRWWGRPFLLQAEMYYKYLWDQVPYIINNVRQIYYPGYRATGYAAGVEARLGGEFIRGTESWFSLGVMTTRERIDGVDEAFVRRPTDQRLKLAFVFEDHIPGDSTWRVRLNFQYGSGLPVGPPGNLRLRNIFGGDSYTRLDIGFYKDFNFHHRFLRYLRAGVEINNLLGTRNAVTYTWITDVNNQQFAVPNYLTGRLFNVVLSTAF